MPDRPGGAGPTADQLLDGLGLAVVGLDGAGTVTVWNRAAERLYGWPAADIVGRPVGSLVFRPFGPDVVNRLRVLLRDGGSWSRLCTVRHQDGTAFDVVVNADALTRGGQVIGASAVSSSMDVGLRQLLDGSPDAALILTTDARIAYTNHAVEHLTTWTRNGLVGRSMLRLVHPDDRPDLAQLVLRSVSATGPTASAEFRVRDPRGWTPVEFAFTGIQTDGTTRAILCHLRPGGRRAERDEAVRRADQLETALHSRVIIEQAKGLIAARTGITTDEAFDRLRDAARGRHTSIQAAARSLIAEANAQADGLSGPEDEPAGDSSGRSC